MAQTGLTPIITYHSTTPGNIPAAGNLVDGELAVNIADMKLYCKNSVGTVQQLNPSAGGGGTVTTVSVASANGLSGAVTNPSTTPAITLGTTVTGLLKGNGTAISAAVAGTDYTAANTAVPLAGGTMTGALVLNANPAAALGAATKQYVDAVLPAQATNAGKVLTTDGTVASWQTPTAPIPAYGAVGAYTGAVLSTLSAAVLNGSYAAGSLGLWTATGCSSYSWAALGLTGTWRCMGYSTAGAIASQTTPFYAAALFVRIA